MFYPKKKKKHGVDPGDYLVIQHSMFVASEEATAGSVIPKQDLFLKKKNQNPDSTIGGRGGTSPYLSIEERI